MIRAKITTGLVSLMFLFLIFGLFNLEIIHGRDYRELGDRNCIRLLAQNGSRGRVLDRNGMVIADNKLSYDLMILPQDSLWQEKIFQKVSRILGKSVKELDLEFKKRFLTKSMPVTIARNLELKQAIALDEARVDFPSIIVHPNPIRRYPNSKLACHLLGYLGEIDRWRLTKLEDYGYNTKDVVGFGGVEEKYDYYLRAEEGGISFQVDHRGRFIRNLGFKPPVNGKDIQLTIDIRVQKIAESVLEGRKGAVVIMNPYSGEIIAMASSPGFNPKDFIIQDNTNVARLFNDRDSPLINRAISGTYPAGSVFKMIVAAAALENKKINQNTSFLCRGGARIGKQEFKCWGVHGQQNLIEALTHSCNVFFYKTGLLVGAQSIHDYALKFGLSRPASFDLPYEKAGFIPSPLWRKVNKFQSWFDGDTVNLSIGQGDVLVTPLQIARMTAVFANGGYLVTPYITKAIDGRYIVKRNKKAEKLNLKASTISYIREGLRGVVRDPNGTGNILSGVGVTVAGKTGTAQAPPHQAHAWFCGFFPFEKPKFVITVLLEHGGPGYNSAVLSKRIIEEMKAQDLL
jgi:penicillin-binding protein 2